MSIIDDLLVLVEDNEKISLEEIYEKLKNTRRQTIASSLGRLTSKGWLNKNKQGKSYLFSISKNGHETINKILDNIQYILTIRDQIIGILLFLIYQKKIVNTEMNLEDN
jgi:predicted transcriptional regulator